MFRLAYRQRRRLSFCWLFATLTIYLTTRSFPEVAMMYDVQPVWFVTLAIAFASGVVGLGLTGLFALIVIFVPMFRRELEILCFVFFIDALLHGVSPTYFGLASTSGWGGLTFLILLICIYILVYGEALDRFRLWVGYHDKRSFISPRSADHLWAEMVPGKAPPAAHWDSLLYEITPIADDPGSFDVVYTHGHSLYQHLTITYLDEQPNHLLRYFYQGEVDKKNANLVEGTFEIRIDPLPKGGCRVTFLNHDPVCLPRLALMRWFDDDLGDRADHIRARHWGKWDWSMAGRYRKSVGKLA